VSPKAHFTVTSTSWIGFNDTLARLVTMRFPIILVVNY
jgi:hypothetical protein